jgi:hypothetical protein
MTGDVGPLLKISESKMMAYNPIYLRKSVCTSRREVKENHKN